MYHSDNSCHTYSIFCCVVNFFLFTKVRSPTNRERYHACHSHALDCGVSENEKTQINGLVYSHHSQLPSPGCLRMDYILYLYSDNIILKMHRIYLIQVIRHSHIHRDQESSFLLICMIEERKEENKIF